MSSELNYKTLSFWLILLGIDFGYWSVVLRNVYFGIIAHILTIGPILVLLFYEKDERVYY